MSGGVDSSACAVLLKSQGYECLGATMKLHSNIGTKCSSEKDILDAGRVCEKLKIPHSVADFSSFFNEYVVENFISSYENGATPNPCIECNYHLKFNKLFCLYSSINLA